MIKDALGYKFHWAVADYLQRAARHLASKSDVEQAYALGKAGVEFALQGHNSIMPTVVRKSSDPYVWEVGEAPLSEVANVEKFMPGLHQRGRLRHHRQVPRVPVSADRGRGLSALREGDAQVRDPEERPVAKKLDAFEV